MPHETVKIHIDKKLLESPTPTTGAALYALGSVLPEYDLFQELPGQGDDLKILKDGTSYVLKNGTHFYTAKQTLNPGNGQ